MSIVTNKDLIEAGVPGGPYFPQLLETVNWYCENADFSKAEALVFAKKEYENKYELKTIPLRINPDLKVNIEAHTDFERKNLDDCKATMIEAAKTPTVVDAAILPDACPAGSLGNITVGGVIGAKDAIHPGMHSADICCSVMATNLGKVDPKEVMDVAFDSTSFGPFGKNRFFELDSDLKKKLSSNRWFKTDQKALDQAEYQLGTQGDGNHFYFVGFSKATGDVYLVSHHGSRGVGASLYKSGMKEAKFRTSRFSPETRPCNSWLDMTTQEGQDYWEALQLVRDWTRLNHSLVHDRIAHNVRGADIRDRFWNEHNFVFKRNGLYYHAKGATPAWRDFAEDADKDGRTIVPLNMSEPVLITKGLDNPNALGFSPHGAGRNMSRTVHKALMKDRTNQEIYNEETRGLDVRFQAGDIDISELPSAYKDANTVIEQIESMKLATIEDCILPYGSIMAGDIDLPWKRK